MKYSEGRKMKWMLIEGVVLLAGGGLGCLVCPETHWFFELAQTCMGIGIGFTGVSAVLLLLRKLMGEKRARARDLARGDERAIMVAYKSQNLTAIAAVLALCAMTMVSTVRGDALYRSMGIGSCFALCAVKLISYFWYNKKI